MEPSFPQVSVTILYFPKAGSNYYFYGNRSKNPAMFPFRRLPGIHAAAFPAPALTLSPLSSVSLSKHKPLPFLLLCFTPQHYFQQRTQHGSIPWLLPPALVVIPAPSSPAASSGRWPPTAPQKTTYLLAQVEEEFPFIFHPLKQPGICGSYLLVIKKLTIGLLRMSPS